MLITACSTGDRSPAIDSGAVSGPPQTPEDTTAVANALADAISSDLQTFSGDTSPAMLKFAPSVDHWDTAVAAAIQMRRPGLLVDGAEGSVLSVLMLPEVRSLGDTIIAQAIWRRCASAGAGKLNYEQDSVEYKLVRVASGDAWQATGPREVTHSVGDCRLTG
jgi:hypothetical protein